MKPETVDPAGLQGALAALRAELGRLGERLAALEAAVGVKPAVPPPAHAEDLSEEVVAVISAAIAAFLGKKPHIRQIRLVGTTAWAQQGRVTIQASHALSARHTRSAP
jgi:methylmalonyl-CoA carboxyltransferase large subunit